MRSPRYIIPFEKDNSSYVTLHSWINLTERPFHLTINPHISIFWMDHLYWLDEIY